MERKCVICGAVFHCYPSDNKVTCSPACRSKRAAQSAARTKKGTRWTDEQRERLKTDEKRREQMASIQAVGVAAALSKPEGQKGISNRAGLLWILIDPCGRKHAAINLMDWSRENYEIFFPQATDVDHAAETIHAGFMAIAASMRGVPSRLGQPVESYKEWRLDRLPIKIDNRCAEIKTVEMLDMWLNGASVNAIHNALGYNRQKITKTLISVGVMNTNEARLFRAGLTTKEIAERLGESTRLVEGRIPYSKGAYLRDNPTGNAINIRKTREKEKSKMNADYYNYKSLVAAALAPNAAQSDIDALGEWFHAYGWRDWNGECYHVDAAHQLYPIYREIGEDDYDIVGYTFDRDKMFVKED